jgi:hypothetical protein
MWSSFAPLTRPLDDHSGTTKNRGETRGGKSAKGNPHRRLIRPLPLSLSLSLFAGLLFLLFSSSLSSSTTRPRRLTPTALPCARGLTKSTSRARSFDSCRSLASLARGEYRRFPRRAKVTASSRARERRRESPARTLTRGGQLR